MCYILFLSTDAMVDLSLLNEDLIAFSHELPDLPEKSLLQHQYKWFVNSNGCSCAFRHLAFNEIEQLGFGKPEDWFPEETEDIEATLKFVCIIRNLLKQGANVDCINVWWHDNKEAKHLKTLQVFMDSLKDEEFRFGEGCHFIFLVGENPQTVHLK